MNTTIHFEHAVVFGNMPGAVFYKTQQWRSARYAALKLHGNRCQLCGSGPQNGITLHVDHIKPRSLYPEICLDQNNLQVLCEHCHIAKGVVYQDDFRGKFTKIDPSGMREFFQLTKRHMILGWRHPLTRAECAYLGDGVRSQNKKHRSRWRLLVKFCFCSKVPYSVASQITVSQAENFPCMKNNQFNKFYQHGGFGLKNDNDKLLDINGYAFPEQIALLLANDEINVAENGGAI